MYGIARRKRYNVRDLPTCPQSAMRWLNRIFKRRGSASDFQTRLRQAVEHVEVGESKRPLLAMSLDDAITHHQNLYYAYCKLSSKNSAAGPDGVTWDQLYINLNDYLQNLSQQLKKSRHQRKPERVIEEPKPIGGIRYMVLQSTEDRLIDRACAQCLSIALDPTFSNLSFAYRPRRSCWHALRKVRSLMRKGYHHWVICDICDAFGSVSTPRLLDVLDSRLPSDKLKSLISRRLANCPTGGLRQGSPLSPVMLNLYLDHFLDRPWVKLHPETRLVRYADDIAIACRSYEEAVKCYEAIIIQLRPHGMSIKENAQQAIVELGAHPVSYLGFLVSMSSCGTCVTIGEKGLLHLEHSLAIANRKGCDDSMLNALGGWLDYFGPAYKNENKHSIYAGIQAIFASLNRISIVPNKLRFFQEWELGYKRYISKVRKPLAEIRDSWF